MRFELSAARDEGHERAKWSAGRAGDREACFGVDGLVCVDDIEREQPLV
jgi:hypothetical protein